MLETNSEFRTEMKSMLYSENSFFVTVREDDLEEGTKLFKVDLSKIERFYFWIDNMSNPEMDNEAYPDVHDFQDLFELLFLKGHRMKYLLIECERQLCNQLAYGLAPLSMQRNIHLVHFRSCQAKMYRFFRFLEGLMMSDQPIPPFNSHEDFWEESRDDDLLTHPDKAWFVDGLDTTTTVVDKSEEQMEATAKELYSVLRIERDFVPHDVSELDGSESDGSVTSEPLSRVSGSDETEVPL